MWLNYFSNLLCSVANQSGSFSTDGITQLNTTNSTFVQCRSNHLTSFAVLVNTMGVSLYADKNYHTAIYQSTIALIRVGNRQIAKG